MNDILSFFYADIANLKVERLESRHKLDTFDCGECEGRVDNNKGWAATTVLLDDNMVAAYFTLLVISHRFRHFQTAKVNGLVNDRVYPTLRLARLAVHKDYQNRGLGTEILDRLIFVFETVSPFLGCSLLTCEAWSDATDFYSKYGFVYAEPPAKKGVSDWLWKPISSNLTILNETSSLPA